MEVQRRIVPWSTLGPQRGIKRNSEILIMFGVIIRRTEKELRAAEDLE